MTPFKTLTSIACPLPLANTDTDQLIPARYLLRPREAGYGAFLLHDLRFGADGTGVSALALDDPAFAGAEILVSRRNFGSGSSREAAVYALADHGIRAVIAPSFGDIFAANAVNNGVLPARVSEAAAEALLALLAEQPAQLAIDLETLTIAAPGGDIPFSLDPVWRDKLMNGWDDLDFTLSHEAQIKAFAAEHARARPWMIPPPPGSRR